MMKKHILLSFFTMGIFLFGIGHLSNVFAQQSLGLSVSPPVTRITVMPGKAVTLAFNITNTSGQDILVTPSVVDFKASDKTGEQTIQSTLSIPITLANSDKEMNTPFILSKDAKDQVVVQMTFPEASEEKDYYETLLFKVVPQTENTIGQGTYTNAEVYIGANMLISVSKTGEDGGNLILDQFNVPRIIDMFSSLPINLVAKNNGKTYTTINGTVEIYAPFENLVKTYQLLPEDVLVDSIRKVHSAENDPEDTKNMVPKDMMYKQPVFIGPYTVKVDVHAPNQEAKTVEKTIWALPISPTVLLIFIAFLYKIVKKSKANLT